MKDLKSKSLLISSMEGEAASDMVIEYVRYLNSKININRHNVENRVEGLTISFSNKKCNINVNPRFTDTFNIKENSMWYRRGNFILSHDWNDLSYSKLKEYLTDEEDQVNQFLHLYATKLSGYMNEFVHNNKLNNLFIAQKVGIAIPDTYILTKKTDLIALLDKYGSLITKSIAEGLQYRNETSYYQSYTEIVDKNLVKDMGR